jgi:hypothetical protein
LNCIPEASLELLETNYLLVGPLVGVVTVPALIGPAFTVRRTNRLLIESPLVDPVVGVVTVPARHSISLVYSWIHVWSILWSVLSPYQNFTVVRTIRLIIYLYRLFNKK